MPVDRLIRSHAAFKSTYFLSERELFDRLAIAGQQPEALVISCSDSRVIPELILNVKPGQLFVLRNVANLIPRADEPQAAATGAAIEYAIGQLGVRHLIVLGHYGCGGIRAMIQKPPDPAKSPHLAQWLTLTNQAVADMRARLGRVSDEVLLHAVVEDNVLEQLEAALTYPTIRAALDADQLTLHGWVWNLGTGEISCFDERQQHWVRSEVLKDEGNAGRVTPGQFED